MENKPKKVITAEHAYRSGELVALRALILAVIDASHIDRRDVVPRALTQLELERTMFLDSSMPETYDAALTHFEDWLRSLLV